jgi:uncharacterized protein YndB with AHSA1/START domain
VSAVENLDAAERELVIIRTFDAPRELVFKVFTDPRHAINWWGPSDYPVTQMEIDAWPGGRWRHCLTAAKDGRKLWQGGVFQEVVAPALLSFTFAWEEEGERGLETLVTITFADEDGKTRMMIRQTPFRSTNERDGHRRGWNSSFDRLVAHLLQLKGSTK